MRQSGSCADAGKKIRGFLNRIVARAGIAVGQLFKEPWLDLGSVRHRGSILAQLYFGNFHNS
jgi:hypothetical protein